eukprot:TRINITY_DN1989_c0_g1_i1.p1 TRINITY_DN1989_c0_g1~~TRINITY_DN1989_c0_g1_i1.p1  ORF type:complete len:577 (-),score=62.88 TRINITY_DN1989_c0_g1_i1:195-1862(-)
MARFDGNWTLDLDSGSVMSTATSFASFLQAGQGCTEWDGNLSNCSICEVKFTFLRRRHHCRSCGRCVCHGCSRSRVRANKPGVGRPSRPKRICSLCIADAGRNEALGCQLFIAPDSDSSDDEDSQTVERLQCRLAETERQTKLTQERLVAAEEELERITQLTFLAAENLQALAEGALHEEVFTEMLAKQRGRSPKLVAKRSLTPRGSRRYSTGTETESPVPPLIENATLGEAFKICETALPPIAQSVGILRQAQQYVEVKTVERNRAAAQQSRSLSELHLGKRTLQELYMRLSNLSGQEMEEDLETLNEVARACNTAIDIINFKLMRTPTFNMDAPQAIPVTSVGLDGPLARLCAGLYDIVGKSIPLNNQGRNSVDLIALCEAVLPSLEKKCRGTDIFSYVEPSDESDISPISSLRCAATYSFPQTLETLDGSNIHTTSLEKKRRGTDIISTVEPSDESDISPISSLRCAATYSFPQTLETLDGSNNHTTSLEKKCRGTDIISSVEPSNESNISPISSLRCAATYSFPQTLEMRDGSNIHATFADRLSVRRTTIG